MKDLEALHHQAMEFVDRAILAKQQGDEAEYLNCLQSAFAQERSAADL